MGCVPDNIVGGGVSGRVRGTDQVDQRLSNGTERGTGRPVRSGPHDEAELIRRIREGQSEEFAELVARYQDRLFNTCWRICGNLEDARDITQDAFLKAYERLDSFKAQSGFYTWLYRIAVNLALSFRRTGGRRRHVSLEAAAEGTQAGALARDSVSTAGGDPAAQASDIELHRQLARALQTLEDDFRAVIVLRDIEGFDYREIGEILEIPRGTVKSRLHRAREQLRQDLDVAPPPARRSDRR